MGPPSFAMTVPLLLQLFSHYSCPWVRKALGLQFTQFVDTLNVFALGTGAELVLRFPGPNEELICEYGHSNPGIPLAYAKISA